jgi:hypothetical protein
MVTYLASANGLFLFMADLTEQRFKEWHFSAPFFCGLTLWLSGSGETPSQLLHISSKTRLRASGEAAACLHPVLSGVLGALPRVCCLSRVLRGGAGVRRRSFIQHKSKQ